MTDREQWLADVDRVIARPAPEPPAGLYLTGDLLDFLDRHPTVTVDCLGCVLSFQNEPGLLLFRVWTTPARKAVRP